MCQKGITEEIEKNNAKPPNTGPGGNPLRETKPWDTEVSVKKAPPTLLLHVTIEIAIFF